MLERLPLPGWKCPIDVMESVCLHVVQSSLYKHQSNVFFFLTLIVSLLKFCVYLPFYRCYVNQVYLLFLTNSSAPDYTHEKSCKHLY